jgi:serine acetyltransferase
MRDVPANSTAVGVPARILPHEYPLGPAVSDDEG